MDPEPQRSLLLTKFLISTPSSSQRYRFDYTLSVILLRALESELKLVKDK